MDAPRMRTAKQASIELRKMDPGTAMTERAIRRMLANNDVPYVAIGNKKLINMDLLLAKLAGSATMSCGISVCSTGNGETSTET